MFLYMLVEYIKNNLKRFNNTHAFEPNISLEVDQSVAIQLPSAEDGEDFSKIFGSKTRVLNSFKLFLKKIHWCVFK